MSGVKCNFFSFLFFFFFFDKVVGLVGGGSGTNGAYPVSFSSYYIPRYEILIQSCFPFLVCPLWSPAVISKAEIIAEVHMSCCHYLLQPACKDTVQQQLSPTAAPISSSQHVRLLDTAWTCYCISYISQSTCCAHTAGLVLVYHSSLCPWTLHPYVEVL